MTPAQVLQTYDAEYAARYDANFLLTPEFGFLEKTSIELLTLRMLTLRADAWLDVACGTGWFLKRGRGHPDLRCVGLDLSEPMLRRAREVNPDAEFLCGDFREEHPELDGAFDVVSCMWGAYGLQESLDDVHRLVGNLARWTRAGGSCFMPVFLPSRFAALEAEGRLLPAVTLDRPDGTLWSYVEEDGKRHDRVLAPPVATLEAMFAEHFEHVEISPYPETPGVPMGALIAGGRG